VFCGFRTKRRRIRAHFGSSDNILTTALTIGQRRTARGIVGGYMLKVDARHGVKGLFPASESYFLDRDCNEPLHATCWALTHLFVLQLQNCPLTLFHLESAALERCAVLIWRGRQRCRSNGRAPPRCRFPAEHREVHEGPFLRSRQRQAESAWEF